MEWNAEVEFEMEEDGLVELELLGLELMLLENYLIIHSVGWKHQTRCRSRYLYSRSTV